MAKGKSRLQKLKQDALALWDERFHAEQELSRLHRFLHFWVLVAKSFNRNRCPIRASALSFTTLLALIPVLAVAISITSALLKKQGEEQIYHFVDRFVSAVIPPGTVTNSPPSTTDINTNLLTGSAGTNGVEPPSTEGMNGVNGTNATAEIVITNSSPAMATKSSETNAPAAGENERTEAQKEVARRIHEFIHNTRSGTLGVTGAILLVLVGIRMFGSIESTFNDIWGLTRGRNWLNRILIYCTTILVSPFLLTGAAALTSGPHLKTTHRLIAEMPVFGPMIFPTLSLIILWFAFALFYFLVPNTKVRFSAALVGGIVGGTIWHVNNLFGFLYVSRVVSNSRIYGSLGLVPVFMAGIYLSWLFLLFGAQVAYAFQNRALYLQERLTENVNQRGREFVALRLMTCIGQRFQRGLRSLTSQEMSEELCIPSRLVHQVLQTLIAARLVIEIAGEEPAYTPARPLEQITAHHILQAMRARGQELFTRDEPVREEVYGEFARIQEAERKAASSVTMLALVHRAEARLELAPPVSDGEEKTVELSPALVPAKKPQAEASPLPLQHGEIQPIAAATAPEPAAEAETPTAPPKPVEKISSSKPVVEPVTDEERDFPL
ncbi:MAG TPA: YhjD/YihY/BrkB family envelope integrity protein [Verrucomicrobiae bacterium]|jgi:membrane protein|nr:YhjD/YihY/BrkB family envelope integrity protein [Verrucomicrobiae bacterium]